MSEKLLLQDYSRSMTTVFIFSDIQTFWNGHPTVMEVGTLCFRHGEVGCPLPQSFLASPVTWT